MSFILFVNKNNGNSKMSKWNIFTKSNEKIWRDENFISNYLRKPEAPTYLSEEVNYFELPSVSLFFYNHGSEVSKDKCVQDDDGLFFILGTVIDLESGSSDPKYIFKKLQNNRHTDDIQGDYISFGLNSYGNGAFHSTLMSFISIFCYEDEAISVFSTDIKLIFNSLYYYRKGNVCDSLDLDFIHDSIHCEWSEREFPMSTMIEGIRRLPSTTFLTFGDYIPHYSDNQFKLYDKKWDDLYVNNKKIFYDEIFEIIERTNNAFLKPLAGKNIEILISGGLDSRLCTSILSALAPQNNITLSSICGGPKDHPDVVIGKKVAEDLNISFLHNHTAEKLNYPQKLEDYIECMKLSQGDWNSNNFRTGNTFIKRIIVSGQSNYKKHNWAKIYSMNRWYAARMQHTKTLPILSTEIVNKIALIYGKHNFHYGLFEFAYELLKRFTPSLLDIPLVGMSIPQHFVDPYSTIAKSKIMPSRLAEAFWDPDLVSETLVHNQNAENYKYKFDVEAVENDERKRRISMDFASIANEQYL